MTLYGPCFRISFAGNLWLDLAGANPQVPYPSLRIWSPTMAIRRVYSEQLSRNRVLSFLSAVLKVGREVMSMIDKDDL